MLSHIGINFNIFTFPGSIALIFSPEEGLMASKTVYKFSSEKRTEIKKFLGGFINKKFLFSLKEII